MAKSKHAIPLSKNRKLGDLLGEYLDQELGHLCLKDMMLYMDKNTSVYYSEDGFEGIGIIFCPKAQVLYHFHTVKTQKELGVDHYINVHKRGISPQKACRYFESRSIEFLGQRFASRMKQDHLFHEQLKAVAL